MPRFELRVQADTLVDVWSRVDALIPAGVLTADDAKQIFTVLMLRMGRDLTGAEFVLTLEDMSELAFATAESYREASPNVTRNGDAPNEDDQ